MSKPMEVTIVGGGMITNDLLLPSIYHLQRTGVVGDIHVCALNAPPLRALRANPEILGAKRQPGYSKVFKGTSVEWIRQ